MVTNTVDTAASQLSTSHASEGADYTSLHRGWTDRLQQAQSRIRVLASAVAMLSLALTVTALTCVYLAVFRQPAPYVLQVDDSGGVAFGGYLDAGFEPSLEMIPSQIQAFVEHWRTVTPDNTQQKRHATRLFCMVPAQAPARGRLIEWFRDAGNDPFERNRNASVSIDLRQISKLAGATWQVEWYETLRAHDGRVEGDAQAFKATMIVETGTPPKDCIEGNPLGVYVQELNWTQTR